MKTATSILMLDGHTSFALPVAWCLSRVPRVQLHVVSRKKWVPLRLSRHRATFHFVDPDKRDEDFVNVIADIVRKWGVEVVLPVAEDAIRFTSIHRQALAALAALPPQPDVATFDAVSHKQQLMTMLETLGFPFPATVPFSDDHDFAHEVERLGFPVLLKPNVGKGGSGIWFCGDRRSLEGAIVEHHIQPGTYTVQKFIDGYDVDMSVLCRNGTILAYTIQRAELPGPTRFAPPSRVAFIEHEQAFDVVSRLMAALRWNGVAHVDMRYDAREDCVRILEINPRYWSSILGSLLMGVNFPHLACLTAMGKTYPLPGYRLGRFVTRHKASLTQKLNNILGTEGEGNVRLGELSLRFVLDDPLPEALRLTKQWLQS